jgi:hypothetical protein
VPETHHRFNKNFFVSKLQATICINFPSLAGWFTFGCGPDIFLFMCTFPVWPSFVCFYETRQCAENANHTTVISVLLNINIPKRFPCHNKESKRNNSAQWKFMTIFLHVVHSLLVVCERTVCFRLIGECVLHQKQILSTRYTYLIWCNRGVGHEGNVTCTSTLRTTTTTTKMINFQLNHHKIIFMRKIVRFEFKADMKYIRFKKNYDWSSYFLFPFLRWFVFFINSFCQ